MSLVAPESLLVVVKVDNPHKKPHIGVWLVDVTRSTSVHCCQISRNTK